MCNERNSLNRLFLFMKFTLYSVRGVWRKLQSYIIYSQLHKFCNQLLCQNCTESYKNASTF